MESLSPARLYKGKFIEARNALAPVYNRFKEGFKTAAFRAKKAAMKALS